MPRIAAATIREHNQNVLTALVDAAEELLRDHPGQPLTAGAVATSAGIARNSIYKHVASVDELRSLVIRRHITPWATALEDALRDVDDPADRVHAWARVNLEQAALAGHGWLVRLALDADRSSRQPAPNGGPTVGDGEVSRAHRSLDQLLVDDLASIMGEARAATHVELVRSLVDGGMRRIDHGDPLEVVAAAVDAALRGLLAQPAEPTQEAAGSDAT